MYLSQPSFRFAMPAASDREVMKRLRAAAAFLPFLCFTQLMMRPRFVLDVAVAAAAAVAACFPPGVLLVFWGNNLNFVRLGARPRRRSRWPRSSRSVRPSAGRSERSEGWASREE